MDFRSAVERISGLGHEIGLHSNAMAVSLVESRDKDEVLQEALAHLRQYAPVCGTAAHGDPTTRVGFTNSASVYGGQFQRLAEFGLYYDCDQWVKTRVYLCDSGGKFGYGSSTPFADVVNGFPHAKQVHALIHPQWWFDRAFDKHDLYSLGALLDKATMVCPMSEVAAGRVDPMVIGLRHDIDDDLERAVKMAEWEHERGFRSSYYFLHTSPYWNSGRAYGTGSRPGPNTEWLDAHRL